MDPEDKMLEVHCPNYEVCKCPCSKANMPKKS